MHRDELAQVAALDFAFVQHGVPSRLMRLFDCYLAGLSKLKARGKASSWQAFCCQFVAMPGGSV
jgi:hypothetical protein